MTGEEPPEEGDDPRFTRREALAALAGVGALGAGAVSGQATDGDTVLGIGGGSMADEHQNVRVKKYVVSPDEFRNDFEPGQANRLIKVFDEDEEDELHGTVAYDYGGDDWGFPTFGSSENPVPSITTDEIDITKAALAAGNTYAIIEHSGEYLALDQSGSVAYSDSDPDLGALLDTISSDINPSPGVQSAGESHVLNVVLQARKDAYRWADKASFYTGLRLSLTASGKTGALIDYQGPADQRVFEYLGDSSITASGVPYRYNNVTLSNLGVLWHNDRESSASIFELQYVNSYDISNLFGHFTDFDLTDRIKQNEDVNTVPGGSGGGTAYFLSDHNDGISEHRQIRNCWVVGSQKGFNLVGDHLVGRNLQVFYANPQNQADVIRVGGGNGGNDRTLIGCHVYTSGGEAFRIDASSGDYPTVLVGCVAEDSAPNGFVSQAEPVTNNNGSRALVLGFKNTTDVSATLGGDRTKTTLLNGDSFDTPPDSVGASAVLSSDQSVADTTETRIAFDSTRFDARSEFDTTNNEFVASEAGKYRVDIGATFSSMDAGDRMLLRVSAGSTEEVRKDVSVGTGGNQMISATKLVELSSGDNLYATAFHDSGEAHDIPSSNRSTWFTVSRAR